MAKEPKEPTAEELAAAKKKADKAEVMAKARAAKKAADEAAKQAEPEEVKPVIPDEGVVVEPECDPDGQTNVVVDYSEGEVVQANPTEPVVLAKAKDIEVDEYYIPGIELVSLPGGKFELRRKSKNGFKRLIKSSKEKCLHLLKQIIG